jgi:hypothetical protein
LKESGLAGDDLLFREALMAGSTPAGSSLIDWRIGGVRLISDNLWRWDQQSQGIIVA